MDQEKLLAFAKAFFEIVPTAKSLVLFIFAVLIISLVVWVAIRVGRVIWRPVITGVMYALLIASPVAAVYVLLELEAHLYYRIAIVLSAALAWAVIWIKLLAHKHGH